ncbi:ATP-dependent DNA ligase [Arthrobacter sp.]|uniref:ATP-dependent DNA ligase n=1 Tax=Arthrobacter sp. TaxID=1667 RepID=UPI00339B2381
MATRKTSMQETVNVDEHRLRLTNLDKVLYPETGTTKAEVIAYYSEIAEYLIPHAADRPVTRKRWVHGVGTAAEPGQVFFQKNLDKSAPDWVKRHSIEHKSNTNVYPLVNDRATLTWLAQIAALEIHVPQWKFGPRGKINNPDRMVLDLDPGEGAGLPECVEVAFLIKDILEGMGLDPRPVTSGSKGIHLYAGLDGKQTSDEVSQVAHELARLLEADHPDLVVSDMKKSLRQGKVLVDWSQNNWAKTTIAPYSLRGRPHPTVAVPRTWQELQDPGLTHLDFQQVLERVKQIGDPLSGMAGGSADEESLAAAPAVDRLSVYRSMRDPDRTPEPVPAAITPREGEQPVFVIQEHHARRLHYDVRLEHNGVLASWAVPKGPPVTAGKNHLAVQTEDHPMEYATFEGTIPKGEYGAGVMTIWDSGSYEVEKWRDGKEVIVVLHGRPDGGLANDGGPSGARRYALIHTGGEDGKSNWLMHLMKDQPQTGTAQGEPSKDKDKDKDKGAAIEPASPAGAGSAPGNVEAPRPVKPMLAVQGTEASIDEDDGWAYEMKWDGIRALAVVAEGKVRLISRNGQDMTKTYPELWDLPDQVLAETAVLDGEIVALDAKGRPDFGRLQNRMNLVKTADIERAAKKYPVEYFLFDLLELDGTATLGLEYSQRREILKEAVEAPRDGHIQVPPGLDAALAEAVAASREVGLEGIIAKRTDSNYAPGLRTRSWIKIKHQLTQEVVIVGWRPGKGSRARKVGSLLVAVPDGVELSYLGRVGSGLTERELAEIGSRLKKMSRKTPPLEGVPAADASDAHWVRPALVGEVQFSERTEAGRLRHPVWRGFRPDKKPSDVVVEIPQLQP